MHAPNCVVLHSGHKLVVGLHVYTVYIVVYTYTVCSTLLTLKMCSRFKSRRHITCIWGDILFVAIKDNNNDNQTLLKYQFVQNCNTSVNNSPKCLNYKLYKQTFKFENYLIIVTTYIANCLCKFRCMSHRMPMKGVGLFNIRRELCTCHLCTYNVLGDEYHYLLECPHVLENRSQLFCQITFFVNPNMY